MKLSILLAGSILTSAIVGNVYAQTCGAQPSCSSLGYTYTGSTSDCVNTPMKCPFNTSYFNCTKKADALAKLQADIVTAVMPDYSKAQSRNCGSTYTATANGYLIGYEDYWDNWSGCKMTNYNIKINNINVRLGTNIHGDYVSTWFYPIKKGHTYSVPCTTCRDGNYGIYYYSFVPLS